jgi:peptide/nickel transport system permease protein
LDIAMGKILRLVGRRLWQLLPIIVFATFVVFSLLQLVPGDPAVVLAGDYASEQRIAEIRQLYGLDQPFLVQYGVWLLHALEGNLGRSLLTSESVSQLILYRLPNTLLIAVYALLIAGVVGVALGVAAATRVGTRLDAFITGLASLGVALPSFWLAMILVATLSLGLHWFPTTGAAPLLTDPCALIEVLNSQYIRTLRAKGLSSGAVLWKHGLRNISVTLLTLLGLQVNRLFSGAVVIEAVFAIPGVGSLVATSALNKDFPVVQGVVLVLVVIVILINLMVDVLNALLDPRAAEA